MVKGLTRAFSCRIFAGRKQTLNTATMDFKRIAHHAVRRWNKKRKAEKAANTPRTAVPQEETLPKAANLKSALWQFPRRTTLRDGNMKKTPATFGHANEKP